MSMPHTGNNFTTDLQDELISHLSKRLPGVGVELSPEQIEALALDVALDIHIAWGGQPVYIPQPKSSPQFRRRVYGEFNGSNVRELIARYHLGYNTIYDIIKQERAASSSAHLTGDGLSQLRFPNT